VTATATATVDVAPWAELVTLAERERELALAGRWDEVAESSAERVRLAATLGQAPAAARGELERLGELQAQITAAITVARAWTVRELGELGRGRIAVRGYGASGRPAARSRVDGRG
jgi:hypothetical protein